MAEPSDWHGANKILKSPKNREYIPELKTFNNGTVSVSCWKFTGEEIAEIVQTGCIFIGVMGGPSQPPIFVGNEEAVRAVTLDTGPVWPKHVPDKVVK